MEEILQVKRNYKDTLFRLVFKEKEQLLSLYNAVNGTNYTDTEQFEIVTLENAVYMNMKNDLAFVVDYSLNLYEHQSTYSPNMPLRNLFYIAKEMEKLVSKHSLYSTKQIKLPMPEFIVFYNGTKEQFDKKELKLSDAFMKKTEDPQLELCVTVININFGKNDELLSKCKELREYMQYVDKVRKYSKEMDLNFAVEKAIVESIHEGILEEVLTRYRAEAVQVSIFEYDEEKELKLLRQDERELGREEGREEGKEESKEKIIQIFVLDNLEENIPEERILEKLTKIFELSKEEAKQKLEKYRK